MTIVIYKTPQRRDDALEYSIDGETLEINGTVFDLSGVSSPQAINSEFVVGNVFKKDGDTHVRLIIPYGADEEPCVPDNDMPVYLPEPTVDDYRAAIQSLVDQTAQSRQYDSGNSLASYAASTNQAWSAEAQAFIAWRDRVWAYAYSELEKVEKLYRTQPTVEEFLAELPVIAWPTLPA